jgi:hypothetical protein
MVPETAPNLMTGHEDASNAGSRGWRRAAKLTMEYFPVGASPPAGFGMTWRGTLRMN